MAQSPCYYDIFIYTTMHLIGILLTLESQKAQLHMKNYQKIFEEAQELVLNNSADIYSVLLDSSKGMAPKALFINCHTGGAIYNGTTYSFNLTNPELLNYLLQKHEVRYLILVDAAVESLFDNLLPSPQTSRPKEEWNHLWELYKDLYDIEEKSAADLARLRVLFLSMLLSQQDMFKVQYFNQSLVNIFGWLYCSEESRLRDLYLDMFHAYEE